MSSQIPTDIQPGRRPRLDAARAPVAGEAVGIERSAAALAYARALTQGRGNVRLVEAGARVHPFEPAAFDGAFSRFGVVSAKSWSSDLLVGSIAAASCPQRHYILWTGARRPSHMVYGLLTFG
jgi:hypothetical protein